MGLGLEFGAVGATSEVLFFFSALYLFLFSFIALLHIFLFQNIIS